MDRVSFVITVIVITLALFTYFYGAVRVARSVKAAFKITFRTAFQIYEQRQTDPDADGGPQQIEALNEELARAAFELTHAREKAVAHGNEVQQWVEEVNVLKETITKCEAEKLEIQRNCSISVAITQAEATRKIEAAEQGFINATSALYQDANYTTATSSELHKNMKFFYTLGETPGDKVMHARATCNGHQITHEDNKAIARPCKVCFNRLLPVER